MKKEPTLVIFFIHVQVLKYLIMDKELQNYANKHPRFYVKKAFSDVQPIISFYFVLFWDDTDKPRSSFTKLSCMSH